MFQTQIFQRNINLMQFAWGMCKDKRMKYWLQFLYPTLILFRWLNLSLISEFHMLLVRLSFSQQLPCPLQEWREAKISLLSLIKTFTVLPPQCSHETLRLMVSYSVSQCIWITPIYLYVNRKGSSQIIPQLSDFCHYKLPHLTSSFSPPQIPKFFDESHWIPSHFIQNKSQNP